VSKLKLLLALTVVSVLGQAATLTTTTSNNGSGGIFLELTSLGPQLNITGFETYYASVAGSAVAVEIYTRPGTYAGYTASSVGWTLLETVNTNSAGPNRLAMATLSTPISIGAHETLAVYLAGITSGGGLRYTGGLSVPQTTWSTAELQLVSAIARTTNVPFGGTQFTPRTFAGVLYYEEVPEPASMGLAGLGLAALVVWRRRKS